VGRRLFAIKAAVVTEAVGAAACGVAVKPNPRIPK
jgi:hypothetical protein